MLRTLINLNSLLYNMTKKRIKDDLYSNFSWEEHHEQALKDHISNLQRELSAVKKENNLLRQKLNKKQNKQVEKQ
jgi:hypothetical protein